MYARKIQETNCLKLRMNVCIRKKNTMRILIIFLLGVFICTTSQSQRIYTIAPDDPLNTGEFLFIDDLDSSLIIDYDLTTNKEYLTYLAWLYGTFIDYPENYDSALPDAAFAGELFDPAFANEPVKGISLDQAEKYCEWRTDRFNEAILVREGILNFDPNQMGEENFNTSAYLCGQYMGSVRNVLKDPVSGEFRSVIHRDFILLPSFHVASEAEINDVKAILSKMPTPEIKKVNSPLDRWLIFSLENMAWESESEADIHHPLKKYYDIADKKKDKFGLLIPDGKKLVDEINSKHQYAVKLETSNVLTNPVDYRLRFFDKDNALVHYSSHNSVTSANPFLPVNWKLLSEKDSIGRMPFIWVADEKDGTPLLVFRKKKAEPETATAYGFYCAMDLPYRIYLKREYGYALYGRRYLFKK